MFAIIESGSNQYKVWEGGEFDLEKLNDEDVSQENNQVIFKKVLLVSEGEGKVSVGTPFVANAQVSAEVVETFKDAKVLVFKKKRRHNYRRLNGHRQQLTRVKITKIALA